MIGFHERVTAARCASRYSMLTCCSLKEAAALFDCSYAAARSASRRHYPGRRPSRGQRALALVASGETIRRAAELVGVGAAAVYWARVRAGKAA